MPYCGQHNTHYQKGEICWVCQEEQKRYTTKENPESKSGIAESKIIEVPEAGDKKIS